MRLNSSPTCQLRQGGKNDVVNQQTQEYNMNKKLELFIVKPNDDSEKTLKNFIAYLERQGIKVKRGKYEK